MSGTSGGTRVDLGLHLWAQNATWRDMRDAAVLAEAAGFRYVWTWDHLLAIFGDPRQPALEGWTALAALAEATASAEIGLLVSANTFRNPGLVAKMAATVDEISGGRAILGIGAAWCEREHLVHGIEFGSSPGERLRWLDEAVVAIRALLSGEAYTSRTGDHYSLVEAFHAPRPVRGRMPILIGGGGERKTLRIVAEHADLWNVMGSPDEVARKSGILDEHCADVGRSPHDIRRTVTIRVLVRDHLSDAERAWQELLEGNGATGLTYLAAITGEPERVADGVRAYVDAGFDTVIIELPAPYDAETIERLPGEVLPLL